MQVVLASQNANKLRELGLILAKANIELHNQNAYNIESIDETGLTFVENALLKARHVSHESGLPAIADDSGLVVNALDGAPGIYSARYAARSAGTAKSADPAPPETLTHETLTTETTDAANNRALLSALADHQDRSAYFFCALVYMRHANDPCPLIATAAWHGQVLSEPQGSSGFGYDPVFYLPDRKLTAAQLDPVVKNQISHRGQAAAILCQALQKTS
ncbi:MAG: RdgB/HAM1 family non-canonical purine NTP pyrophosphatase [Proteobacteria bacterium]|nr:RdgB/HAM1 family non-canonical purine NTP pyrophosphatase [Pseudomonadota bacterium]